MSCEKCAQSNENRYVLWEEARVGRMKAICQSCLNEKLMEQGKPAKEIEPCWRGQCDLCGRIFATIEHYNG